MLDRAAAFPATHSCRRVGRCEDRGPTYSIVDFDHDPAKIQQAYSEMDATGLDLSAFRDRGETILIYQALADAGQPPEVMRQWYEEMSEVMGGEAMAMDFARLFLVPGMDHCGTQSNPGVGRGGFNPLPAPEKWVEEGVPPKSIVMTKTTDDGAIEGGTPGMRVSKGGEPQWL